MFGMTAEAEDVLDATRLEVLHQLIRDRVFHGVFLEFVSARGLARGEWSFSRCLASARHAPRRAAVAIRNFLRHRPHHPAAALLLLPCVGENADRARQDEQAAAELRFEAQFAEDDCRDAVDVHRDVAAGDRLQRILDRLADRCPATRHRAGRRPPWRRGRTAARCADRPDGNGGRSRARSCRRRPAGAG